MSDLVRLAAAIVLPQAVVVGVALGTARESSRWYPTLRRPAWSASPEALGPLWTLAYLLMGLASFVVWGHGLDAPGVREALVTYLLQLLLAGVRPLLFFRLRSPLAGVLAALAHLAAATVTLLLFFRVSAAAGWLFSPVFAWTVYALALTWRIRRMNRG